MKYRVVKMIGPRNKIMYGVQYQHYKNGRWWTVCRGSGATSAASDDEFMLFYSVEDAKVYIRACECKLVGIYTVVED